MSDTERIQGVKGPRVQVTLKKHVNARTLESSNPSKAKAFR